MISRRSLAAGVGLAAIGALAAQARVPAAKPQGLIDAVTSEFNDIQISRSGDLVTMHFIVGTCAFTESQYDEADPARLPVAYTRTILAALAYVDQPRSLLEIGVGGGRTISYLQRHLPKLQITGVEIDPAVIAMAKKHFGLAPSNRLRIVIEDGRRFVFETKEAFDIALIDAYRGTWVPETLTTVEFFQGVKARLNPGGVVAQNVEPTTLFYDRIAATLAATFDNVDAYPSGQGLSNTVLIAYDGPRAGVETLRARAAGLEKRHQLRHPLAAIIDARRIESGPFAEPLRDGFEGANAALMIDKANSKDTPRARREQCGV